MALVHNIERLKPRRRELRRQLTIAEARLWNHLKDRKLCGRKFRRQHSVGPYILDFYCPGERLAVELDGAAHDHEAAQDRDSLRTLFLQGAGIRLVRFENRQVIENLEGVLVVIARQIHDGVTTPAASGRHPSSFEEGKVTPRGLIAPRGLKWAREKTRARLLQSGETP